MLPFANLSGDPQQDYFSDRITEDVTTELSRFSELIVIGRSSAFQYKGKAVDLRQIGRELGARYLLEGSVGRSGGWESFPIDRTMMLGASGGTRNGSRIGDSAERLSTKWRRAAELISGETTGRAPLGDRLSESKGVICPPKGVDPGIVERPPPTNAPMPVIPPHRVAL